MTRVLLALAVVLGCAVDLVDGLSTAERFRLIDQFGLYASAESASGPCSEVAATGAIRRALPELLSRLRVSSLLDAPCGDFNWMSRVDLGEIDYVGVDIVPEIVARNRARFRHAFLVADMAQDDLPPADLILCRDALAHLDNATALAVLRNFTRSGASWLLSTTFTRGGNPDIKTGQFRPIDLRVAPFALGEPVLEIDEQCALGNGAFADKRLSLWELPGLAL